MLVQMQMKNGECECERERGNAKCGRKWKKALSLPHFFFEKKIFWTKSRETDREAHKEKKISLSLF